MFRRRKALTRESETQLELELAESLVELQLVESLAHELQTPLVEASVQLDILTREKLTPQQEAAVRRLRGALGRSRAAIESVRVIRPLGRGESVNRERIPIADVAQVVKGVLADLKHQYSDRGIRVLFEFGAPSSGGAINVDSRLLDVAVREVLKNAYQYSFTESTVTVQVNIVDGHLWLTCQSTGISMGRDEIQRCTEPGWRAPKAIATGPEGRGLGLWLANRIAALHGGQMKIESSDARTLVEMMFPLGVER